MATTAPDNPTGPAKPTAPDKPNLRNLSNKRYPELGKVLARIQAEKGRHSSKAAQIALCRRMFEKEHVKGLEEIEIARKAEKICDDVDRMAKSEGNPIRKSEGNPIRKSRTEIERVRNKNDVFKQGPQAIFVHDHLKDLDFFRWLDEIEQEEVTDDGEDSAKDGDEEDEQTSPPIPEDNKVEERKSTDARSIQGIGTDTASLVLGAVIDEQEALSEVVTQSKTKREADEVDLITPAPKRVKTVQTIAVAPQDSVAPQNSTTRSEISGIQSSTTPARKSLVVHFKCSNSSHHIDLSEPSPKRDTRWVEAHMDGLKEALWDTMLAYVKERDVVKEAASVFVECPKHKIDQLYSTMFGVDWESAVREAQERKVKLQQDFTILGLFGAGIFQEVFQKALPWESRSVFAEYGGSGSELFKKAMAQLGLSLERMQRWFVGMQLADKDKDFFAQEITPYAAKLARSLLLKLPPHLEAAERDGSSPDSRLKKSSEAYLAKAFEKAIEIKLNLFASPIGPFNYRWPAAFSKLQLQKHSPEFERGTDILHALLPSVDSKDEEGIVRIFSRAVVFTTPK